MILVICDKVGERLAFHRYLRRNRVLAWAPSPIDFQSAILARDYSVVVLFYPFHPMFSALDTGDAPRIAVGEECGSNVPLYALLRRSVLRKAA